MAVPQMSESDRVRWLRRWMAGVGIVLFAVTWKLWTPQTVFPQIPFFGWLVATPVWIDWIACAGVAIGLLGMLGGDRWSKRAMVLFLSALVVLVLLNQHRLQPWAYLMILFSVLMISLDEKSILRWCRRIVISIYFYSAISKLDYQFSHSVGREMVHAIGWFFGLHAEIWASDVVPAIALSLPAAELLVAMLLCWSRTRVLGGWLAIGLHVGLLLVLGPFGLDHLPGVLIWNVLFIGQAWLLFIAKDSVAKESVADSEGESRPVGLQASFAVAIAMVAIAFPLTRVISPAIELPIICDHWVAWEVYAPRSSRAYAQVGFDKRESPANWSLESLGVPVYPQARFQVACWFAKERVSGPLAGRLGSRIYVRQTADRLTGRREEVKIGSKMAAERFIRQHWLNLEARGLYRGEE
jgi:hypothetical protein